MFFSHVKYIHLTLAAPKFLTNFSKNPKSKISFKSSMGEMQGMIHPGAKLLSICEPVKSDELF